MSGLIRTRLSGADFTSQIQKDVDFQIFWSEISIPAEATEIPVWLPHFYFDPVKLRRFDPEFDWRGNAYFSTGAFACKRNFIPFEKWLEAELWEQEFPGLFADFYEQPLLNYFVDSMTRRGEIKSVLSNLQHVWSHHGKAELVKDCVGAGWHFPKEIQRPRAVHFCGRKPFLFDRKAYSRPFTIARLEHHRRRHGDLGAWSAVLSEDRRILANKVRRGLKGLSRSEC